MSRRASTHRAEDPDCDRKNTADSKGDYHYNTKSKASWYWSRTWGAATRLNCKYWVLTDWQRWVYGSFDDDKTHGYVSPIISSDSDSPYALQALFYWAR